MNKPSYTMSIVTVKPDATIPETLLHKLLSENRSSIGLVTKENGKMTVEKFGFDEPLDTVEQELKEAQLYLEGSKKFQRMLCFGSFPEGFSENEVQPWIIIRNSKDEPIVVAAIEGSFPWQDTKEGMSEAFALLTDYLGPKIEGMYELLSNDPKKLDKYLRSNDFSKDIAHTFNPRAEIVFMTLEGDPFAHGKNELGGVYDWGTASNVYGYSESVVEAATPEKVEEPPRRRSKFADDPPEKPLPEGVHRVPEKTAPQPEVIPLKNPDKPDPIDKAATDAVGGHWQDIPKGIHGKRKKAYIRGLNGGVLPPDHEHMTRIWIPNQTTVKSLADLSKTAVGPKDMKADAPVKQEESVLPVISGQQHAKVVEFIKSHLDANSNKISNPLELQKLESKFPMFTELAGVTLEDIDMWPVAAKFAFCKSHPEAAALLLIQYGSDRRKTKPLADIALKDIVGTATASPTSATEAPVSQSAGTASSETPTVHKKSRFA